MDVLIPLAVLFFFLALLQSMRLYMAQETLQTLQNGVRTQRLGLFLESDLWVVTEHDTILAVSPFEFQARQLAHEYGEQDRTVRLSKLSGYIADTYWQGAADAVLEREAKRD